MIFPFHSRTFFMFTRGLLETRWPKIMEEYGSTFKSFKQFKHNRFNLKYQLEQQSVQCGPRESFGEIWLSWCIACSVSLSPYSIHSSLLHDLNIPLQGEFKDVFTLQSKMDAFKRIYNTLANTIGWCVNERRDDLRMFLNFEEYMTENDVNYQVVTLVQKHSESLTESFTHN